MTTQRLDETRLAELVKDAQGRKDFSSPELGSMIDHICRVVLNGPDFVGYDECLQMEMYGNGAYDAVKALATTADVENKKLFSYLYTTVTNAYKHTLKKFYSQPLAVDDGFLESRTDIEPYYIRNRRRLARGIIERNKSEIIGAACARKMPLLKNVINRASKAFAEMLTKSQMNELIRLARKAREAIC